MTTTTKTPNLHAHVAMGFVAGLLALGPIAAAAQTTTHTTTTSRVTATQTQVGANAVAQAPMPAEQPTPAMKKLLATYMSLKPKPLETLKAPEARKQPTLGDAVLKQVRGEVGKLPTNDDIKVETEAYKNQMGDTLPVKVYATKDAVDSKTPRPVIVYFHGGGWVIADVKTYERSIMQLARKTGAIVIAPEYRQGPENRFPAAHEDSFGAYQWALANAKRFNGDMRKIAVVGESAGGNLAAYVGMQAVQNNLTRPLALGLIYPVAGTDMTTPSYLQNAHAKPLSKPAMAWFFQQIVRPENMAAAKKDPRLDLVNANLAGLPPTTVITAGIDPLRSEGEMLSQKLERAGVGVNYRNYDGVTHEFFGADLVLPEATEAQDYLAGRLKAAFAK